MIDRVMRMRISFLKYRKRYKKAELTPGLPRDRAATCRLIMNWNSSSAIEALTFAAT